MIDIEIRDDKWIQATGYRKQILADSAQFSQEGVYAQVVVIEPGNVVAPHYHKQTYEFYYVLAGDVAFTINDHTRRLKQGDMMMTEPDDVHKVENDSEQDFRVLVFKSNAAKDDTFWMEKD